MKVNSLATKAIEIAIALASSNWLAVAQPLPSDGHKDCRCNPDPHFKTWDDTYYDYHGQCDLVLIKNALVDLQIQTFALPGYSAITRAALRVGGDEFTIDGGGTSCVGPPDLDGYPFSCTPMGLGFEYELTLDDGQFVRVTDWYGSLSVLVRGGPADFSDAVGMCGTWTTPGYIDRDGNPLVTDPPTEMGEEWAVIPSDVPIIDPPATCTDALSFGEANPTCEFLDEDQCLCTNPDSTGGEGQCLCCAGQEGDCAADQCLGCAEGCVTQDQIDAACDGAPPEVQEDCKFDVQTTGDVTWGEAPFYKEPAPPLSQSFCKQDTSPPGLFKNKGIKCEDFEGAQCVFNCVTSRDFVCKPNLCGETDDAPDKGNKKKDRCACKVPKHVMAHICSDD